MASMEELSLQQDDYASITSPPWGELGRSATLGMVSGLAKLLLRVLNTTTVVNYDTYLKAVMDREKDVGLITVSNHTSLFDDPGIVSAITPWWFFWTEHKHQGNRWTACAKEVCFKNEFLRQFFQSGKTMPIVRGEGLNQPAMQAGGALVGRGGWMHLFPEGRVMFTGLLGPFRWGAGKMVCDARLQSGGRDPIVLPVYHSGMGDVLPMDWAYIPYVGVGHTVTVNVGEPLDLSDLTCRCNSTGEDQQKVWVDITSRMHQALTELEKRSPPNRYQGENPELGLPGKRRPRKKSASWGSSSSSGVGSSSGSGSGSSSTGSSSSESSGGFASSGEGVLAGSSEGSSSNVSGSTE